MTATEQTSYLNTLYAAAAHNDDEVPMNPSAHIQEDHYGDDDDDDDDNDNGDGYNHYSNADGALNGTRVLSESEERRIRHNITESERRKRMKMLFDTLEDLVINKPRQQQQQQQQQVYVSSSSSSSGAKKRQSRTRVSRAQLIQSTVERLAVLKQRVIDLEQLHAVRSHQVLSRPPPLPLSPPPQPLPLLTQTATTPTSSMVAYNGQSLLPPPPPPPTPPTPPSIPLPVATRGFVYSAFQRAMVPVFVLAQTGVIRYINEAAHELFARPNHSLMNENMMGVIARSDLAIFYGILYELATGFEACVEIGLLDKFNTIQRFMLAAWCASKPASSSSSSAAVAAKHSKKNPSNSKKQTSRESSSSVIVCLFPPGIATPLPVRM